ncbi:MAG: [protein-PII] uridylyltransferase [Syntrophales bacterium]
MRSAPEELKESREHLVSQFSNGTVSANFRTSYTEIIDHYFRRSLQESEAGQRLFADKERFAFVAVGGYGREELCLHSDIDIMVLFDAKISAKAKELVDEIFFPLWDLGLDLGYAVRRIKDCMVLSRDDFGVLTSVMNARFLCGDSPAYLALMAGLQKKIIPEKATAFAVWLDDRDKIRMDAFGDASYLLEPQLKEGIGGLRDYHHMLWLAAAFFGLREPKDLEYQGKLSSGEYQELRGHLKFIWLVRNHLHYLSGRRNDRLSFEYQEEIARRVGFKDKDGFLAVEQFMGRLHASMGSLKSLHRAFVRSHISARSGTESRSQRSDVASGIIMYQGEMFFDSSTVILSDHCLLMDIFDHGSRLDCTLSLEAKRLVREFLFLVDDAFRKSDQVIQGFLNIMNRTNTFETLEQMYETGFLDAFIPEFGKVKDLVQFDAYHTFPVGRHCLETVRFLKSLERKQEELLLDIFSEFQNSEPLFLAGLLHDIGKVGKSHAHRGVEITRNILARFDYDKDATEDILFLVEHHLFLVETSTRRDLNDEKVIVQCARTIGDVKRLKMLYLITWADSKATGPRAWTGWIANLVQELFFKVLHIIEMKELATPQASESVEHTKCVVRSLLADKMNRLDPEEPFEIMSPRYLLNTAPQDVVRHLTMIQQHREHANNREEAFFCFEAKEDFVEDYWEVTFLAKDRPGVFCDLAGVLALRNINILSAHIYTWRDGTAVDILKVTSPLDRIHSVEVWDRVKRDICSIFKGRLSLRHRLGKKAEPSLLSNPKKPSHPPQVNVDNESSDFFTLIEVFADDRMGLLYLITRTLFDLKLDIRIAKISTKADQIVDIFYVRDLEGQKVTDKEHVNEIKRALLYEMSEG